MLAANFWEQFQATILTSPKHGGHPTHLSAERTCLPAGRS